MITTVNPERRKKPASEVKCLDIVPRRAGYFKHYFRNFELFSRRGGISDDKAGAQSGKVNFSLKRLKRAGKRVIIYQENIASGPLKLKDAEGAPFSRGGVRLKKLMRAIDRFCLKHRRFGIPRLMLYFVIGYAAVYLIALMDRTNTFISLLTFNIDRILRGEVWRIVTWLFIPEEIGFGMSSLILTALMLYFYYFIANALENEWGTAKFTIYYLTGVVMQILYAVIVWLILGVTPFLSTHFLNLSMFFAFAALYPDHRVLLFFIIPIKIKWLAWIDGAYFLVSMIIDLIGGYYLSALMPVLAFFNFYIFCGHELISRLRPTRVYRPPYKTVDFREAAKRYRASEEQRPYRHKCAVCGKTDTQYPGLEFRYCSRCNGYHCFCIDHINNHVHFQ